MLSMLYCGNPFLNKNIQRTTKLTFTKEQQNAYEKIEKSIKQNENKEFLIFGVTGSRKNRNIFTTNRRYYKTGEKQYNACARNFTYTTNSR